MNYNYSYNINVEREPKNPLQAMYFAALKNMDMKLVAYNKRRGR